MLRDFDRFAWFSDGWLARAPTDPTVIGDARYSLRNDRYEPVWGIRFHPGADQPTEWVNRTRNRDVGVAELWDEISGRSRAFRPLP
jgi:inner membrane protein